MNQPAVHFEEKRTNDPETEAILDQARQVVLDRLPERKKEFETRFNAVSRAASNVRGQILLLAVMSFFRSLFKSRSPSETFQLN